MSSLIEQAVKRLEELRRAGVEIPPSTGLVSGIAEPVAADRARSVGRQDHPFDAMPDERPPVPVHERPPAPAVPPSPTRRPPRAATARVDIDLHRLEEMGYLVPSQAQSLLADLLRVIKRPLLQNMRRAPEDGGPDRRANVIVVTSSIAGEGKTFVATNLAMSIALEVDHSVILVDGDVLRPAVFNRLALEPRPGLMDLLVQPKLRAADLLVDTNVDKLALLGAGTAQDRAEELLASAGLDRLLDELSMHFPDRVIVIDSPPLLVTTESRALAESAGQVVLVVEADRTPREQITRAFETLVGCPIVLSVLNKSRAIESDYVYGY